MMVGEIAQLVEQWTENPCVRSSILRLATSVFYRRHVLFNNLYQAFDNFFSQPPFVDKKQKTEIPWSFP
jgi:hypothetical protein